MEGKKKQIKTTSVRMKLGERPRVQSILMVSALLRNHQK